ncbi:hypothetical protein [Microlunatus soli]|uniref:Uncharacterized protein n=1 Tax=Microlunatus soli TaxID=630515 RepID=A0A1H1UH85_9ACTN|nr:hypothetical protein [Microlunatus soli]SDS71833.1 hypothetical protein SAMN04489812_2787 [Microlunatus soli]
MPDPNDPPDPGPIDELQRETERILRTLADRSAARAAQRERAEQNTRQPARNDQRQQQPSDERLRAEQRARRESRRADRVGGRSGTESSDLDRSERPPARAAHPEGSADPQARRLAERLAGNGIGGQLAETRIRAERSHAAPASAIRKNAAAGRGTSVSSGRRAQRSVPQHAADHRNRREQPRTGRGRTR